METTAVKVKRNSLLRSTTNFASMTFVSRILGFCRDLVIARTFGTGPMTDAFIMAFRIPNLMRNLFAEGAFSQAFVPTLSEVQTRGNQEEVRRFISHVAGLLFLVLSIVTTLAVLASPGVVMITAPGFIDEPLRFNLTAEMLRVTFPYLLLISLTALCSAVLNSYGYFGITAFTPVLLNVTLIFFAVFVSPYFHVPVKALAWGILTAGILQLFFQIPFLYRAGVNFMPQVVRHDPQVKKFLRLMLPAMFGVAVTQINLFIDSLFATFLIAGSVSWLYFSVQLSNLPLGLFGVSISTVIMPKLSRSHASGANQDFYQTMEWGLKMVLLIAVPAALGLAILAKPIVITLFLNARLTPHDADMIGRSIVPLALGLPAFMLVKILTSGFYARHNIPLAVKLAAVAGVINIVLNILLIKPLAHVGLALATCLAAYCNTILLAIACHRKRMYRPQSSWLKYLCQIGIANAALLLWLLSQNLPVESWLAFTLSERIMQLLLNILVAVIVYFATLFVCGIRYKDINPNQSS